jgi:hypothetical protein
LLSQIDPGYFATTDLLWASLGGTKHSVAQALLVREFDRFGGRPVVGHTGSVDRLASTGLLQHILSSR